MRYGYIRVSSQNQNTDSDANADSDCNDDGEASKVLASLRANEVKTAEVKQGIKDLIEKVSDSSASPKSIVEKLEALLNTLEN